MSLTDIVKLLTTIKVSNDFPIDLEVLKKGFIESIKVIQSGVPEEDITEVAKIVNELLASKDNY